MIGLIRSPGGIAFLTCIGMILANTLQIGLIFIAMLFELIFYVGSFIIIVFWLPSLILFLSFQHWFIPQIKKGNFHKLTSESAFPEYQYVDYEYNRFRLYVEINTKKEKAIYCIEQLTKPRLLFNQKGVVAFWLAIFGWRFFPFGNWCKQIFLKYLYTLAQEKINKS